MNTSLELARRNETIPTSCVRTMLSGSHDLISLAGGVPHPDALPTQKIREASNRVFEKMGKDALAYGASEGEENLRQWIAKTWLPGQGIHAKSDEILLTQGSQQALDLIGKVLIDPHSAIAVERPTYLAALQAFSVFEPEWMELGNPETQPRFAYLIPNFQNPTGRLMPLAERQQLARFFESSRIPLVEDDPYGELYYDKAPPLSIHSMAHLEGVLLGTFSKMIAPGLRVGWIWCRNPQLRNALLKLKQASDLCGSRLLQAIIWEFLQSESLDAHLERVRQIHREQRDLMARLLEEYLGDLAQWELPHGGMFFWLKLNGGLNGRAVQKRAIDRGVAIADGESFYAVEPETDRLRLNFTQCPRHKMEIAIRELGYLIREMQMRI